MDPFYRNPLKAIISQDELKLLKAIVNEPEPIVDIVKEKKEIEDKFELITSEVKKNADLHSDVLS